MNSLAHISPMSDRTLTHSKPWCFVDIETTGGRAQQDRIIEIGVVRVENGHVVKTWQQLVNPGQWLPDFIVNLTHITPSMLEAKPSFADIAEELLGILDGSLFVAHNARFDYSFIKAEFRRLKIDVSWPQLCTVRLSRILYPQHHSHSLDSLIERHQIRCNSRHRALGDAEVIWHFFTHSIDHFGLEKMQSTVKLLTKEYALPPQLLKINIDDLPPCTGVYIFYGENGEPLYIGKSKHIRSRVKAHFYSDLRSDKELLLKNSVHSIESHTTAGELSALLLESELIKKLQPLFNRTLRHHEPAQQMVLTFNPNHYYHIKRSESKHTITPKNGEVRLLFKTKKIAQRSITRVADEHHLCYKLLGLERGNGACMRFHLGECYGACIGKELAARYNLRVIEAFKDVAIKPWPYSGPVVINEFNEFTDQQAALVIDQWANLGDAKEDVYSTKHSRRITAIDIDTYKILQRYLQTKLNHAFKITTSNMYPHSNF